MISGHLLWFHFIFEKFEKFLEKSYFGSIGSIGSVGSILFLTADFN